MPRYIDADALIEMLNKKAETDLEMGLYNHGALTQSFIKFVERQPTSDVVPMAEVDDLKRHIILNEDIAIKCKRENGVQNEEYWKGKISAFRQIRAYIDAEFKKKYTDGQK